MSNILHDIYHGVFSACEKRNAMDSAAAKALSEVETKETSFLSVLPSELNQQYEELRDAAEDVLDAFGEEDFLHGFHLASRIIMTAMSGKIHNEEKLLKKNDQVRALIHAFSSLAENTGASDRFTLETLLEIFEPKELVEMGYADRVRAYENEYGNGEDDSPYTKEELERVIVPDINRILSELFSSTCQEFPEAFINDVINDVYDTSDWQDNGEYSDDDLSLAIQRQILMYIQSSNK